jgi:hypothetical protein
MHIKRFDLSKLPGFDGKTIKKEEENNANVPPRPTSPDASAFDVATNARREVPPTD